MSDTRVSYCVSVTEGQRVTLGGPVLKLEGGEQVTVSEVSLVGPSGIELLGADFVALTGMTSFGMVLNYPPSQAELTDGLDELWGRRRSSPGAVLERVPSGTQPPFNLVLGLRAQQAAASFEAVRVEYRLGDRTFEVVSRTAMRFIPKTQVCT